MTSSTEDTLYIITKKICVTSTTSWRKKHVIFNCGAHPLFLHLFREKTWCSSQIFHLHDWVNHMNLATVETHWQFPELKTQLQPKPRQKISTKTWYQTKKRWCALCRFFSFNMGFFKVFQTKVAAFPSWFFRENPGASLEAPKCCTSRNRRLMTWLGEDVLRWTSHVLCLNVLK